MMLIRFFFIIFLFLATNLALKSQNARIDSLKSVALSSSNKEGKMKIYFQLFGLYRASDYDSSLHYAHAYMDLEEASTSHELKARSLRLKGILKMDEGNFDEAKFFLKEAMNYASRENIIEEYVVCLQNTGSLHFFLAEYDEALKVYQEGITQCKQKEAYEYIGDFYESVGLVYAQKNDLKNSIEAYLNAEKAYLENNKRSDLTALYQNMAGLYVDNAMELQALEYYNKSLALCTEFNNLRTKAMLYANASRIMDDVHGHKKALEYLEQSYEISVQLKDTLAMLETASLIGTQYSFHGYFDDAQKQFEIASELLKNRPNDIETRIWLNNNLGIFYFSQNSYKKAMDIYHESNMASKSIGNSILTQKSFMGMLNVFSEVIDSTDQETIHFFFNNKTYTNGEDFIDFMKSAEKEYAESDDQIILRLIYKILVSRYAQTSQFKNAFYYQKKYQEIDTKINNNIQQADLNRLSFELDLNKKNNELLQATIDLNENEIILQKTILKKNIVTIILIVLGLFAVYFFLVNRKNKWLIKELKTLNIKLKDREQKALEHSLIIQQQEKMIQNELEINKRELVSQLVLKNAIKNFIKEHVEKTQKLAQHLNNTGRLELIKLTNSIKNSLKFEDDWEKITLHFEKTNPDFISTLLLENGNISKNEIKHCIYINMNLSTKEVANLLNISIRSVESARYRLKKKLNIPKEESLENYINELNKTGLSQKEI